MKKNVLFVTADQWRGECLSALGHLVRTPNLDALAAEGTLFTGNFANTAPCGPSRASIHTGMYQLNHRVIANGTPLDERHTNWALEARRAGYRPALFGYTDTTRNADAGEVWDGVLPGLEPIVLLGKSIWAPDSWVAYGHKCNETHGSVWLASRGLKSSRRHHRCHKRCHMGLDCQATESGRKGKEMTLHIIWG